MSEHPQYRMWKDKADKEYEWAEKDRVERERGAAMSKHLFEMRVSSALSRTRQLREEWDGRFDRLPWWDLLGHLRRWLPR